MFGLCPSSVVQLKHHVSVAHSASILRHNASMLGPIHTTTGLVSKRSSIWGVTKETGVWRQKHNLLPKQRIWIIQTLDKLQRNKSASEGKRPRQRPTEVKYGLWFFAIRRHWPIWRRILLGLCWICRKENPLKCWFLCKNLSGFICQKTGKFISTVNTYSINSYVSPYRK